MNNLDYYFEFFRYNEHYKYKVLMSYYQSLAQAKSLSDPMNQKYFKSVFKTINLGMPEKYKTRTMYQGGHDKIIYFNDTETEINIKEKPAEEMMFVSDNRALKFKSDTGEITHFNLVRTKINFNLFFLKNNSINLKNITGELIDVSISLEIELLKDFFDNIDTNIANYSMSYENHPEIHFKGYTINYLLIDLEYLLFIQTSKPWEDKKYQKRLNRLTYLYFIDIMTQITNHQNRLNYLNKYIQLLQSIVNKDNSYDSNYQSLVNSNPRFEYTFESLINNIKRLENDNVQNTEYYDLVNIVIDNISNYVIVILNLQEFAQKQHLTDEDIYETKLKRLF